MLNQRTDYHLPDVLAPLVALPHWVVWRWGKTDTGKPTKVPYQAARPSAKAKNNDPATWSDFATAAKAAKLADGVGFCLQDTDIVAFDIDNCRDPGSGTIDPYAQALVSRAGSYTEITISGTGLRIIGRGTGAKVHCAQKVNPADSSEHPLKVETYRKATRYIVMTGDVLPGSPMVLANIDAVVDGVVAELSSVASSGAATVSEPVADLDPRVAEFLDKHPGEGVVAEPPGPWSKLNTEALQKLPAWVPALLPKAKARGDGYRVTSRDLGRNLQEDLAISPKGIKDFGVADMGDPRGGKRTPIDLIMEHSGRDKVAAFNWLSERLGHQPAKPKLVSTEQPATSTTQPATTGLLKTSAEFVAGFVPPDYLIDGILQRRFFYSMTAPTGWGKTCIVLRIAAHAALGLSLGDRVVEKVRVLFFAGENPDDVRMRWIKLCEEMGKTPDEMGVVFLAGTPGITTEIIRKRINAESAKLGPFGLVIIDTATAYFDGLDENDNRQAGSYARRLRSFVDLPGGPTVIVTCHPTKTPNLENLLPRGGGAFVAEVDGNLVCLKEGSVVDLHTQGKFRGPEFEPIPFKLQPGTSDKLIDSRGRRIWTVTVKPIDETERAALDDTTHRQQDELLAVMKVHPNLSLAELAEKLGWKQRDGKPYKMRVSRTMSALYRDKLVEQVKGEWVLTARGKKAAGDVKPTQGEMELANEEM